MDIRCPKCGEPWDMDSLHDAIDEDRPDLYQIRQTYRAEDERAGVPRYRLSDRFQRTVYEPIYNAKRAQFRAEGCSALGGRCSTSQASPAIGALMDLMGDDLDGVASMLDDMAGLL